MAELLRRYTGQSARAYDEDRKKSKRWIREQEVFSRFVERVRPSSVLDCPFGTGRWAEEYHRLAGPIIGVDLSSDMLDQAAEKLAGYSGTLNLIRADALAYDFTQLNGCDLTVCIRFLNWLPGSSAKKVVQNLARARSPSALFGVSVFPRSARWSKALLMRLALMVTNLRSSAAGEPLQYVHREEDLLSWLTAAGFAVEQREQIFANASRVNFFYLVRRIPESLT